MNRARIARRWLPWLLAAALFSLFCGLGRWQLHRAVEKQAMLDAVAQALSQRDPRPLAQASLQPERDYAWVEGSGHFIPGPALLLDNQRRGDAVGVHVYRAFQPDLGRALLVDLGWLPLPGDRRLPAVAGIRGEHRVRGLLAAPPATGLALGPAYVAEDRDRWLLTRVDIAALAGALNLELAPRVLRLDPSLPIGYPRDLEVLPNTLPPERHRGYALQWFGLAAATLVLALFLQFRRRHD